MAEKILAIDDDPASLRLIRLHLKSAGYQTITASDGQSGLQQFHANRPHLVILDLIMPRMDGWEICRHIRSVSTVPIIMLTALGAEEDIVKGLQMGADDYLVKPLRGKELLARIESVLRRTRLPPPPDDNSPLRFGDLIIDPASHRVMVRGQFVELALTEFNVLLFMARRAGRILPAQVIFDGVWPYDTDAEEDSVRWYIWRLRSKIEADPGNPRYILTERGIGYRFSIL